MTASAQPYRRPSMLLVLLLAVALAVVMLMGIAHTIERHGVDGLNAYNCSIGSDNLIQRWQKLDGRDIYVCDVEGKFGIVVEQNGDLITAFVKEKFKSLAQVERYLINSGAWKVW